MAIDLLFTDVVMPGPLKSADLAKIVSERMPGIGVLFTSGYTENSIVHGGRLDPGVQLLSKPYTREQLARKIRTAIDTRPAGTRSPETQAAVPLTEATAPFASAAAGGKASILIVEDEMLIRMTTADMIEELGHPFYEAGSAEDALVLLERESIDVVITDLGLPGMNEAPSLDDPRRTALLRKPFTEGDFQKPLNEVS